MELPSILTEYQQRTDLKAQFQASASLGLIYSSGEGCRDFIDSARYMAETGAALGEVLGFGMLQQVNFYGDTTEACLLRHAFNDTSDEFTIGMLSSQQFPLEDSANQLKKA